MPEVIDLLSSSPISTAPKPKQTTEQRAEAELSEGHISIFDSDAFDLLGSSDEFEFPTPQPTKKRRLSLSRPTPANAKSSRKLSFLSSDDRDHVFATKSTSIGKITVVAKTTHIDELHSDPITFSSSAPEPRTAHRAAKSVIIDLEADDHGDQDVFSLSQPLALTRTHLSARTSNLLANITGLGKDSNRYKSVTEAVKTKTTISSTAPVRKKQMSIAEDDISTSSPPKPRAKSAKAPAKDKDLLETQRAATKARKEDEKEAEKERKRLFKEEKAREKQLAADLAEVNKSKIDKKNSTPEMIVDMAKSLEGTSVGNQVLEYMKILGVESTFFDEQLDLSESTEVTKERGNLVRWRRKVKAKYNEEIGYWEPIPVEKIEIEKHILVHMTAEDFLEIAAADLHRNQEPAAQEKAMTKNLDAHIASLRSRYNDCKPIYLIEGLSSFLRKNKNAKNRAYTAAVRSQMVPNNDNDQANPPPPPSSQARRRKKKNNNLTPPAIDLSTITESLTESLLLHLQIHTHILIHHSPTPSLSATWIKSFTEHISTIPYRRVRIHANDAVGFCMDVGQVKTGDDRLDTYVKMLQEVQRVTPAMAYGIANRHETVTALVAAFRDQGPLCLQGIRKSANRDGAVSERAIGPAISKRLFKVWMGRDPASTDGIA